MQEKITNYLNEPYPLLLACRKGFIYYITMMLIQAVLLNVLQPLGLTNWNEYHKGLVLSAYSVIYSATYGFVYLIYSTVNPSFFNPEAWTKRKELRILLIFFPATLLTILIFAETSVQEFQLSTESLCSLIRYNCLTGACIVLPFWFLAPKIIQPEDSVPPTTLDVNSELQPKKLKTAPTPVVSSGGKSPLIIKNTHLDAANILFAESGGNYLYIYHIYDGKVHQLKKILTLNKFEELVSAYPSLKRCQKSFVVNINHIVAWEGTLEKMTLHMRDCSHTVSVSEDLSSEFKELMELRSVPKLK
ncbi:MAG: LytTR family DNA-binding domain-containing protein [Paludibacter sp.]|nr:LytTR family DNA-binding domain-containing protein [Paludibacter sp.]